jgi:hypothetical protein
LKAAIADLWAAGDEEFAEGREGEERARVANAKGQGQRAHRGYPQCAAMTRRDCIVREALARFNLGRIESKNVPPLLLFPAEKKALGHR